MLASLFLSACLYKSRPDTYEVDGITIKTGFYGDLYTNCESRCFIGDTYGVSDDLWDEEEVEVGDTVGVHISFAPFNTYSVLFGQWMHYLYVELDQYDDAASYYQDYQNYHYYWGKGTTYDYTTIVELEPSSLLEENYNAVWHSQGTLKDFEDVDYADDSYFFYKISKDGLLTNLRSHYFIRNNKLLRLKSYKDEGASCYEIDSASADYLMNLVSE